MKNNGQEDDGMPEALASLSGATVASDDAPSALDDVNGVLNGEDSLTDAATDDTEKDSRLTKSLGQDLVQMTADVSMHWAKVSLCV